MMNSDGRGRSNSWPDMRCQGELLKATASSQDLQSAGCYWNPGPPECEALLPPTVPVLCVDW